MKTCVFTRWLAVFGWLAVLTARLCAAPFVNGGFESGLTGWTAAGNVTVKSGSPVVPVEGSSVAVFNSGNSTPNGTLSQQLAVSPGQPNRLEFHAGNLAYNTQQQKIRVQVGYRVSSIYQSLVDQVITINGLGSGKTNWQASAFNFTSPSPNVEVTFSDVSTTTNSLDLVLDRVRLATVYQVDVAAVNAGSSDPVDIAVSPADFAGASGGVTPFQRTYLEGTAVTLTAPARADGFPFNGWRQDGEYVSEAPQVTVIIDGSTTLEAVYVGSPMVMTPTSPIETSGIAGVGPFLPSSHTRLLTNNTPSAATWSIEPKENFNSPLADWVTITPSSGVLGAGQQTLVSITINPAALNLPSGYHKAVFQFFTPFGTTQFLSIDLTATTAVDFPNGGFESGLTGWTAAGNVAVQSAAPYGPTEGSRLAAFNAANSAANGSLRRTEATLPGRRYRLEFDAGNLSYNSLHQRLQLDVGEVVGVTTHSHVHDLFDIAGPGGGATAWVPAGYDFTSIGNAVTMVFADASQATNSLDLVLDHVRFSQLPNSSVINGGFENGLDGWTATGNVAARTGAPYAPTGGTGLAVFNSVNSAPNGSLSQMVHLDDGALYRLEFDVGNLSYNANPQRVRVQVQGRFGSGYFTFVDEYVEIGGPGGGATAWQAKSYPFSTGTGAVLITFTDVSPSTNSTDLVLDRVRVVSDGN